MKQKELVLEFVAASASVFPVFLSYLIPVIFVLDAMIHTVLSEFT